MLLLRVQARRHNDINDIELTLSWQDAEAQIDEHLRKSKDYSERLLALHLGLKNIRH